MKVIIVGGGIAGLAAAHALRKDDRDILVLEQSRMHRELGAAISLQPNATKIVHKWGIEKSLRSRGTMIDGGFQIMGTDGKMHMQVPANRERDGAPRVVLHRVDLHEALKEAATSPEYPGKPATIKTQCRVKSVDVEAGSVTLENGETHSADLIVGADGIHSVLREHVAGAAHNSKPTGLSAYRLLMKSEVLQGIIPESLNCLNTKEPWTTLVIGHDKRIIFGPCRNGTIVGVVAIVPDEKMNESTDKTDYTAAGDQDSMLKSFEDFPDWAKKMLSAQQDATLGLWQLRDIDSLPKWHQGRCIIIGDAAHAMLPTQGQGASQSFEDAEALGAFFKELDSPTKEEISSALERFFNCRHERASLIQKYSRQQARPGTASKDSTAVKLNPVEFNAYNHQYDGALDWEKRQQAKV